MARKRRRAATMAAELMVYSPLVAASRLTAMSRRTSLALQSDLSRLAQEKAIAFAQSNVAAAAAIAAVGIDMAFGAASMFFAPWLGQKSDGMAAAYHRNAEKIVHAALKPLSAKVTGNARRMTRR